MPKSPPLKTKRPLSDQERTEALMRIIVIFISGLIFYLWSWIVIVLAIANIVITLIAGKPEKALANFCAIWAEEFNKFARYIVSSTSQRPFPFSPMDYKE